MLNQMTHSQINAATLNPDLRKKLRVDRVRKMTMGTSGALASLEDSRQPDWMKHKSLREIEMIREAKKHDVIHQMLGVEAESECPILNVTPGRLTFTEPMSVINTS